MNIILVSGKLTKARTITLAAPHLAAGAVATLLGLLVLAFGLHYFMLRYAGNLNDPLLTTMVQSAQQEQHEKTESYLHDSLNALASKLGEMQAQMLRLDTLGERLARTAGFKPQEFMFDQAPGRGGAISTLPTYDLSLGDLSRQVDLLSEQKFQELRGLRLRVGSRDLRIAATALVHDLTVVTRNLRDFGWVPGLRLEDWSIT